MKWIISLFLVLSLAPIARAQYIKCAEPNDTVDVWVQFLQNDGSAASATSVAAKVFDPDDTVTPSATPTMVEIDSGGSPGLFRGQFTVPGSPLTGQWSVRTNGTVNGIVSVGIDVVEVKNADECGNTLDTKIPSNIAFTAGNVNVHLKAVDATAGYTNCDVTASTSSTSFTVGSCTDWQGNAVTISSNKFTGLLMMAYTNGGSTCNVNGEGVLVNAMTSSGIVTALNTAPSGSAFSAAPSATNCGVLIAK